MRPAGLTGHPHTGENAHPTAWAWRQCCSGRHAGGAAPAGLRSREAARRRARRPRRTGARRHHRHLRGRARGRLSHPLPAASGARSAGRQRLCLRCRGGPGRSERRPMHRTAARWSSDLHRSPTSPPTCSLPSASRLTGAGSALQTAFIPGPHNRAVSYRHVTALGSHTARSLWCWCVGPLQLLAHGWCDSPSWNNRQ